MRFVTLLVLAPLSVALMPKTTAAQSVIDPDASVVELRAPASVNCPTCNGCEVTSGNFHENCFEFVDDLTDWLWVNAGTPVGRNNEPNALDAVTVRVGPGTYGDFNCEGMMRGFVSVEGAGRDVTRFVSDGSFYLPAGACRGGVTSLNCTNLSFRNVTAEGDAGVLWVGDGDSQWQDVDMVVDNEAGTGCGSEAFPWYDVFSANGLHFFWNTRFDATGTGGTTNAFRNNGAEIWAYGSDFFVRVAGTAYPGSPIVIETATASGMRIFGSTVRAKVEAMASSGSVYGVRALGEFHMHGGIISLNASAHATGAVIGIWASQATAFAHTPDTAFALQGPTKIRLLGPGTIESPFLWPAGATPPDILSQTGSDLFVKNNEGPNQDEARLLVYDNSCSPDPWRRVSNDTCL